MDLDELLDLIQRNELAVTILSLLIYILFVLKRDSFVIVIGLSIVLSFIHQSFDFWLMQFAQIEENKKLAADLWYLGFAASDFIFVFCCYKVIDALRELPTVATAFYLNCYLALGFVQLARYADRILLKTDVLGGMYQAAIPAINSSMVIVTIIYVFYNVAFKYKLRLAGK